MQFFKKRLFQGAGIRMYAVSSESWKTSRSNFAFDEFVYMLNGWANVQAEGEGAQIFNSYEFFTIPKGFRRAWDSNGHVLFKSIVEEKSFQ